MNLFLLITIQGEVTRGSLIVEQIRKRASPSHPCEGAVHAGGAFHLRRRCAYCESSKLMATG
jgi:hypothetical protein